MTLLLMVIFELKQTVNIQQIIIEGLRVQLYRHQYIVLPDFGGFVLKHRPAHFSVSGTQLMPPSATVSFNSQLKQDDGILSAWLQKKLNCSAAEALRHVKEFSGYCKGVLTNKKRLSLPAIGFFHLDFESNICFEAEAGQNFFAGSFGLTAIQLNAAEEQPKPVRRTAVFEDRPVVRAQQQQARRITRPALALLLATLLTAFLFILLLNGNFSGPQWAAFNNNVSAASYEAIVYPPLQLKVADETKTRITDLSPGKASLSIGCNKIIVDRLKGETLNKSAVVQGRYEIVVGCFSVPSNAKKLVKQLSRRGIKAQVSDQKHKGMVVVSSATFAHRSEAMATLPGVQQIVANAWIREK